MCTFIFNASHRRNLKSIDNNIISTEDIIYLSNNIISNEKFNSALVFTENKLSNNVSVSKYLKFLIIIKILIELQN